MSVGIVEKCPDAHKRMLGHLSRPSNGEHTPKTFDYISILKLDIVKYYP